MKKGAKHVKATVANILNDKCLCEEILSEPRAPISSVQTRFQPSITAEELREVVETYDPSTAPPGITEAESIILRFGRPVLFVKNNTFVPEPATFEPPDSKVLGERLNQARPFLEAAIPAVGRIEVEESPTFDWLGTGWLVAEDIMVTNRHVAIEFAQQTGEGFKFRRNFLGRTMEGIIDFREEFGVDEQSEFKLIEVLHMRMWTGRT
jgi:endonuclease G